MMPNRNIILVYHAARAPVRPVAALLLILAGLALGGCYFTEGPVLERGQSVPGLDGVHANIAQRDETWPEGKPLRFTATDTEAEGVAYRVRADDLDNAVICRFQAIDHRTLNAAYMAECQDPAKAEAMVFLAVLAGSDFTWYLTMDEVGPARAFFRDHGVDLVVTMHRTGPDGGLHVQNLKGDPAAIRAALAAYFAGWTDLSGDDGRTRVLARFRLG